MAFFGFLMEAFLAFADFPDAFFVVAVEVAIVAAGGILVESMGFASSALTVLIISNIAAMDNNAFFILFLLICVLFREAL